MMPNRIVREAILSSERVSSLGWPEEVFYRRLMSIVDDYGRTEANLQLLRSRCYPLQTDAVRTADISRWMAACQKAGVILSYVVADRRYLEICNFGQQQRSASKCPPPPADASKCSQVPEDEHLDVSVSVVVSDPPLPPASGGKKRGEASTRCPETFKVTPEMRSWAEKETPGVDVEFETEVMRDHTFLKPKSDWPATWRNWMRRASEIAKQRPVPLRVARPWAGAK